MLRKILWLWLGFISLQASAQRLRLTPGEVPDITLNAETKSEIMASLTQQINANYFNRKDTAMLTAFIEQLSQSKAFADANKAEAFSRMLTLALRNKTNDPHFNVLYNPPMYSRAQEMQNTAPARTVRGAVDPLTDPASRQNFYMRKLEVLDGNIGYFKLERMPDIRAARATVESAMNFVQYSEGLIIDVRGNGGGIGGFTPYLASYFFGEQEKLLFSREFPAYDSTAQFYTVPELGAKRYEAPLWILIDEFTGSAARNLAYTLKHHGRAELVGEATGVGSAGAHSAGLFPLSEGFIATVPIANVVHPVTKSNWSMVGVLPDHVTPASKAKEKAHQLALEGLMANASPEEEKQLKSIIAGLQETANPQALEVPVEWEDFAGAYEQRKVFVEGGKLYLQRTGMPKLELVINNKGLYKIILPPGAMSPTPLPLVRFDRDEEGKVTTISFVGDDGQVQSVAKRLD